MGGPVIETIAPGIQFVPDAARAFRRANAQVRAELGRDIDVNSTYRPRDKQLAMYNAWQRYVASGYNPALHPGHSKALHPDDPLAFHTKGLALDSDDWTNERIRNILEEHGFIRNRLYVPNENHHFEYIRAKDKHYNDPIPSTSSTSTTTTFEDGDMPIHIKRQATGHTYTVVPGVYIKHHPNEKNGDIAGYLTTGSLSRPDFRPLNDGDLGVALWDLGFPELKGNVSKLPKDGQYHWGSRFAAADWVKNEVGGTYKDNATLTSLIHRIINKLGA